MLYMMIQLINGVACLFPGPRYFPLRLKCIQWLNHLSSSSGIFIPVASLVLDVLEYKSGKEGGKPGKVCDFSSVLKVIFFYLLARLLFILRTSPSYLIVILSLTLINLKLMSDAVAKTLVKIKKLSRGMCFLFCRTTLCALFSVDLPHLLP